MTPQDTPAPDAGCCRACSPAADSASITSAPETAGASRRTVLGRGAAVAAVGAGALALSGCTQDIKEKDTARDHYAGSAKTPAIAVSELPVGATRPVEVQGRTLLVHRKDEGTVTAFSNTCTHQGCLLQVVDRPEGPAYACPCHGSHFDVETDKPFGGPARKPLMYYEAAIDGDQVVVKL